MKSVLILSVFLFSWIAQANSKSGLFQVECRGRNSKNERVSFRILQAQAGVNKASLLADTREEVEPGFAQSPRRPGPRVEWTFVEGCVDVSLVGLKGNIVSRSLNGDIAFSCEVNGRYGLVLLSKQRSGGYKGSISSEYGVSAVSVAPRESVAVECQSL